MTGRSERICDEDGQDEITSERICVENERDEVSSDNLRGGRAG